MAEKSSREKRKAEWLSESLRKQEEAQLHKAVRKALAKAPGERNAEEMGLLEKHKPLAEQISMSMETRDRQKKVKAEHEKEVEDPPDVLETKLQELARLMRTSPPVVFHVGAGLSTAAGIPDFRGPQGIWTLQKKGQAVAMRMRYEDAVPTKAHMAIAAMLRSGLVSHVVSQNVDGLLLRAGVPPNRLSELHGCVYSERCSSCGRLYTRSFDVTAANGSAFRRHCTGRQCEAALRSDSMTSAAKATSAAKISDLQEMLQRAQEQGKSAEKIDGCQENHKKGLLERLDFGANSQNLPFNNESPHKLEKRNRRSPKVKAKPNCKDLARSKQTDSESVANYERVDEVEVKPPQSLSHVQTDCAVGEVGLEFPNKDTLRTALEASEGADVATDSPLICSGSSEDTIIHVGEPLDEEAREMFKGADVADDPPLMCTGSLQGTIAHFGERLVKETLQTTAQESSEGADVAEVPPLICGGSLQDTIVHFGERLHETTLRTARDASEEAGLAVVLGTSLKVPPASTLPFLAKRVVIINLQWTSKDKKATLKVNGRCESIMERLSQLLGLPVPVYHVEQDPLLKQTQRSQGSSDKQGSNKSMLERASVLLPQKTARRNRLKSKASFPRPQV